MKSIRSMPVNAAQRGYVEVLSPESFMCCVFVSNIVLLTQCATSWQNSLDPTRNTKVRTYVHTYLHTYINTYIHTPPPPWCGSKRVRTYICTNVPNYMPARLPAQRYAGMCLRSNIPTPLPIQSFFLATSCSIRAGMTTTTLVQKPELCGVVQGKRL